MALNSVSLYGQRVGGGGGHSRICCLPQGMCGETPHSPTPTAPPRGLTSAREPLWTDFTTTALFFSSMSKP